MTMEQMTKHDILEWDGPARGDETVGLNLSNKLLKKILKEIRDQDVTQRCVISVQYSNPLKILDGSDDTCDIRFLSSGKPILAQFLTISNNSGVNVAVGLNEPVQMNGPITYASGIEVAGGEIYQIPVSIEWIQLRLISAGPGNGIIVNNNPNGIPDNGVIQVYGWTHPNSDEDDNS